METFIAHKKNEIAKCFIFLIIQVLASCSPVDQKEHRMTGNLFYKIHGDGATDLVFLHGILGSSNYWDGIIGKMTPGHRLIMLDLLGFGESEKPKTDYSVHKHLQKINSTLSSVQQPETSSILIGHSMGAFLALNYAIAYPRKVKQLVLINAPMVNGKEALKKNLAASSSKLMVTMTFSETWGNACL